MDLRDKLEASLKPAGSCLKCNLPAVKPKRQCFWHLEAGLTADERAQIALERRAAWDGTRTRADGSCASCGVADVPEWYRTGARCNSCGIVDRRKAAFGLTPEQQSALSALSEGKCTGCGKAQRIKALAIDHDHYSGDVRGLLCQDCNQTVGAFFNDPMRFLRLAVYLTSPPATQIGIGTPMKRQEIVSEITQMVEQILNERKLS